MTAAPVRAAVVVPTVGRPSLDHLLQTLAAAAGPPPEAVVVVDDRAHAQRALTPTVPDALAGRVRVLRSGGRGPAAARNAGWRALRTPWVVFLDDDVRVREDWLQRLRADLRGLPSDVAGSQGRIVVPLPQHRRPTDWERNVAALQRARWATADMAYRRAVLLAVGGFDERFPRAYREDADLGLRVTAAGWRIVRGRRRVEHPVGAAGPWVSVRLQAGNAEDPFMAALHGCGWRARAGVPRGRRLWHLVTVAAIAVAVAGPRRTRAVAAAAAAALLADLAWRRIAPGPRTPAELATMVATSAALPFAATWHWVRGLLALPRRLRRPGPAPHAPAAVLFDRDGTLVHDVPYNGDPTRVAPVAGARAVLDRLRGLGIAVGVVSNQSGVGRGLIALDELAAVNRRVEELLGPFDVWAVCPHDPEVGCGCRKPRPGLIERAAAVLRVDPSDCVVVGDIGADIEAAAAAGARPILVPTPATRVEEICAAPAVAGDLRLALGLALDGRAPGGRTARPRSRR